MYYYIMEPSKGKGIPWQEHVKNILGELGIAGETVIPTPGRSIEELTNLGIVKGYSTIVAVGGEYLVNKIITVMLRDKAPQDIVLGIIPDDFSSILAQKVGVKNLRDACETLKYRKLQTIDLLHIEPNKYIITEAEITSPKPVDCYITLDTLQAGLTFNRILIKPGLSIYVTDNSANFSSSRGLLGWFFRKKNKDITSSFFKSKKLKIETLERTLGVKVDNEIIAKTPITCYNRSRVLKIIVTRDKIDQRNDNHQ